MYAWPRRLATQARPHNVPIIVGAADSVPANAAPAGLTAGAGSMLAQGTVIMSAPIRPGKQRGGA